jgi:hypothetical protein
MAELFTSIKHLCYYMSSGKIRLSRQDADFIGRLATLISSKSQVTSNQVGLFNHLLRKYDRQFSKLNLDVNKLMTLPWNTTIVESTAQYTDAYLSLDDGKIIFRAPYNTKFLKHFREQPNGDLFVWVKNKKHFEAIYNTMSLKMIVDVAFKHYDTVHCCPITIDLLDKLAQYDNTKYWTPTLVKVNNRYLIAASNENIDDIISEIELNDHPYTLNYLCRHAINIDEVIADTPEKLFASLYNPIVDYANCDEMVTWLQQIRCDGVYLEHKHKEDHNWNILRGALHTSGIPIHEISIWRKTPQPHEKGFRNPVIIKRLADSSNIDIRHISKEISMVNNKPVQLK